MNTEMLRSSLKREIAKDIKKNKTEEVLGQPDSDPLSRNEVCLHSRKLFSLINCDDNSSSLEFMKKHFQQCGFCQNQYYRLLELKADIIKNIPNAMPDKKMQDSYAMEISELLAKLESTRSFCAKPKMLIDKIFSFFSTLNH